MLYLLRTYHGFVVTITLELGILIIKQLNALHITPGIQFSKFSNHNCIFLSDTPLTKRRVSSC